MKKSKFIKSALILMIGGLFTKLLGMVIRILTSRILGKVGIGIYSLINPTFMLFIALSQLGFPVAISKLVAEEKRSNKKLVLGLIPISIFLNILLMIVLYFISPLLSKYLLHEERCTHALICIGFVLPFISISSILRGYFFGKEKMLIHVFSNLMEDIVRIALILIFLPLFLNVSIEAAVAFLVFSNIASELSSIIIFLTFLPKNSQIEKKDFILDSKNRKDVFSIGIPLTGSRLIGNIGAFLEPIIITSILLHVGYSSSYIVEEYGILNGFVMPILLLPSFFTTAISQAMVPSISKSYVDGKKEYVLKKIKQGIFLSLCVGIPITIFLFINPSFLLNLLYHTNEGSLYLKVLTPIFLLQYIQSPMSSSLQAMGKATISMKATLLGTTVRILCLFIFSFFKIGLWPFVIAISASIFLTSLYEAKSLRRVLS